MENDNLQSQIIDQLNSNSYQLNSGWYIRTYHKLYTSKNLLADLLEKQIKKDIRSRIVLTLTELIVLIGLVILLFSHVDNPDFKSNAVMSLWLGLILLLLIVTQIYTIICFTKMLEIYRFNSFLQMIYQEKEKEKEKEEKE
jgi:hypothetical protein